MNAEAHKLLDGVPPQGLLTVLGDLLSEDVGCTPIYLMVAMHPVMRDVEPAELARECLKRLSTSVDERWPSLSAKARGDS